MNDFLLLGKGLLMGCGLGLIYGVLRPVRPRWLGDLLFSAGFFWAWFQLMFGICGGDLRLAYTVALLGGLFLWESTFGQFLRPVFSSFWKVFSKIFYIIWLPFKNILKKSGNFINFLFARSKKWVTIKCN